MVSLTIQLLLLPSLTFLTSLSHSPLTPTSTTTTEKPSSIDASPPTPPILKTANSPVGTTCSGRHVQWPTYLAV